MGRRRGSGSKWPCPGLDGGVLRRAFAATLPTAWRINEKGLPANAPEYLDERFAPQVCTRYRALGIAVGVHLCQRLARKLEMVDSPWPEDNWEDGWWACALAQWWTTWVQVALNCTTPHRPNYSPTTNATQRSASRPWCRAFWSSVRLPALDSRCQASRSLQMRFGSKIRRVVEFDGRGLGVLVAHATAHKRWGPERAGDPANDGGACFGSRGSQAKNVRSECRVPQRSRSQDTSKFKRCEQ